MDLKYTLKLYLSNYSPGILLIRSAACTHDEIDHIYGNSPISENEQDPNSDEHAKHKLFGKILSTISVYKINVLLIPDQQPTPQDVLEKFQTNLDTQLLVITSHSIKSPQSATSNQARRYLNTSGDMTISVHRWSLRAFPTLPTRSPH